MDGVRLVHSVLMDRIAHYPEALSPYLSQLLPLGRIQSRQADDGPVELIVLFYKLGIGIGQRLQSLVPPLPLCRPLQRVIELIHCQPADLSVDILHAVNVVVEGGRLHIQPQGQFPHGKLVVSLLLHQSGRRLGDHLQR